MKSHAFSIITSPRMLRGENALALGAGLALPLIASRYSVAQTFTGNDTVRKGTAAVSILSAIYFLATEEPIAGALALGTGAAAIAMTIGRQQDLAHETPDPGLVQI